MAAQAFKLGATTPGWTVFHAEELPTASPRPDAEAIRAAVIEALHAPLAFPPLDQSLTPDDHVAIALGAGVPARGAVVAGAVEAFLRCGIPEERLSVVTTCEQDAQALDLPGVTIETHDAADDESLCFAGLTHSERQLMLNRRLFDADVLLPITAARIGDGEGPYTGVFPDFCDEKMIQRFRRVRSVVTAAVRGGDHAAVRRREVEEAGWMFGAPLVVSVVPGLSGGVAEIVAGDPGAVGKRVQSVLQAAWGAATPEPSGLVVAVLGGTAAEQTWSDVGRALQTAEQLVTSGGVIVLWTDLGAAVGPALSRLLDAEDLDQVGAELSEESGEEALAAWRLTQALDRGPIFMKSRLSEETVERLGMAPVVDAVEFSRLVERHGACTVLEEAQHVWLGEPDEGSGSSSTGC